MEPFRFCLACIPVAAYLLAVGRLNAGRPAVISGTADATALGLALLGFVLVGPFELLVPTPALARFGYLAWLLAGLLYLLLVTLALLIQRPRLHVYNARGDTVHEAIERLAARIDPYARRAGGCHALPGLDVEFSLDESRWMRNVTLTAVRAEQNLDGWRTLRRELAAELRASPRTVNPPGLAFAVLGLVLLVAVLAQLYTRPDALAVGLVDWLRL